MRRRARDYRNLALAAPHRTEPLARHIGEPLVHGMWLGAPLFSKSQGWVAANRKSKKAHLSPKAYRTVRQDAPLYLPRLCRVRLDAPAFGRRRPDAKSEGNHIDRQRRIERCVKTHPTRTARAHSSRRFAATHEAGNVRHMT